MDLQSPLGKVRGLGSAKSGTHHWWMQRVTAIALIPLVIWFVSIVIRANMGADSLLSYFESPVNAVLMILFLGTGLYHGCLGLKVILEDYVHCSCGRTFLTMFVNFFTIITAVAVILAVVQFHVGGAKNKGWSNKKKDEIVGLERSKVWKSEFMKILGNEK